MFDTYMEEFNMIHENPDGSFQFRNCIMDQGLQRLRPMNNDPESRQITKQQVIPESSI